MTKKRISTTEVTIDGRARHVVIEWDYNWFGTAELKGVRIGKLDVTDQLDSIAMGTCMGEMYRQANRSPFEHYIDRFKASIDPKKQYPAQ